MKRERARRGPAERAAGSSTPGRRAERVASEIHHLLAPILLHEVRDSRAAAVSITRVQVTADLRLARIYFGLMTTETTPEDAAKALVAVTPFLRRKLAAELDLRFTPELAFFYDRELAEARRVDDLLRSLRTKDTEDDS